MTHKLSADGAAAVDLDYYWQPVDTCPLGVKVQLLSIAGVAVYGNYIRNDDFWVGWAPLPRKRPTQGTP